MTARATTIQDLLLLSGGGRPPFSGVRHEQFVWTSPGAPFGPRPYAADNVVFGDQIDVLMEYFGATRTKQWFQPALDAGADTIHVGPLVAKGYDGEYPPTRWVGRANQWADIVSQVAEWFPKIHLVAWPDDADSECRRYYDRGVYAIGKDSPLGDLTHDFEPHFYHPQIQALMAAGAIDGMDQWEQAPRSEQKGRLFYWMWQQGRGAFAKVPRRFHTPWSHMWPGDGSEGEYECTAYCISQGMTGLELQVHPMGLQGTPTEPRPLDWIIQGGNEPQRTWTERAIYDMWDGQRRALGVDGAPWVMPDTVSGARPDLLYSEWTAWGMYNRWIPTTMGPTARQWVNESVGARFGQPVQFLDGLAVAV